MKESGITIPAEFTVSMTREQALLRQEAAKAVEGVTFMLRDPHDPTLENYALKIKGKLIGTTTVESLDALKRYAKKVGETIPFKAPPAKKAS